MNGAAGGSTHHRPELRGPEQVLARAFLVGAGAGASLGLLSLVWVGLVAGSFAGLGRTTLFAVVVGAGIGAVVGLVVGSVWGLVARPGAARVRSARRAAALAAVAAVVTFSWVLLEGVGVFAVLCALGAAVVAYRGGPWLGVWRSGA